MLDYGSSPRGRGKRSATHHHVKRRGLIPARAGKTAWKRCASPTGGAHPRAGGENPTHWNRLLTGWGSSPRGRGKRRGRPGMPGTPGLIPARAGKTGEACSLSKTVAAHPRAGGENRLRVSNRTTTDGSSPRGRGKLSSAMARYLRVGLIPARAGKTMRIGGVSPVGAAHPRAGGENAVMNHPAADALGSSPRGRGKRLPPQQQRKYLGLIPARAGKTCKKPATGGVGRAHPRAGGENGPPVATFVG